MRIDIQQLREQDERNIWLNQSDETLSFLWRVFNRGGILSIALLQEGLKLNYDAAHHLVLSLRKSKHLELLFDKSVYFKPYKKPFLYRLTPKVTRAFGEKDSRIRKIKDLVAAVERLCLAMFFEKNPDLTPVNRLERIPFILSRTSVEPDDLPQFFIKSKASIQSVNQEICLTSAGAIQIVFFSRSIGGHNVLKELRKFQRLFNADPSITCRILTPWTPSEKVLKSWNLIMPNCSQSHPNQTNQTEAERIKNLISGKGKMEANKLEGNKRRIEILTFTEPWFDYMGQAQQ